MRSAIHIVCPGKTLSNALRSLPICSVHRLLARWCTLLSWECHEFCHALCRDARLYVTGNGQGSPCLDLRRVPDTLADATVGTDLVIVEGMGRAIHTNYK